MDLKILRTRCIVGASYFSNAIDASLNTSSPRSSSSIARQSFGLNLMSSAASISFFYPEFCKIPMYFSKGTRNYLMRCIIAYVEFHLVSTSLTNANTLPLYTNSPSKDSNSTLLLVTIVNSVPSSSCTTSLVSSAVSSASPSIRMSSSSIGFTATSPASFSSCY